MDSIRTCILCGNKSTKERMFRIIADKKIAILDEKQKINSRGIYICKDKKCLINLIKSLDKSKFKLKIKTDKESLKKVIESLLIRMGE